MILTAPADAIRLSVGRAGWAFRIGVEGGRLVENCAAWTLCQQEWTFVQMWTDSFQHWTFVRSQLSFNSTEPLFRSSTSA